MSTGPDLIKTELALKADFTLHVESREMAEQFISKLAQLLHAYRKLGGAKTAIAGQAIIYETRSTTEATPWELNDNGYADNGYAPGGPRRI